MAIESAAAIQVLEEEKVRLRKLHPTPEDIPTYLKVLEDFLNCNIVGSQFRSLYREGQVAACNPKLEEAKFCFSLRSLSPTERRDAWINRRAEWWARRRLSGSSEDVWELRKEPLKNWPEPYNPAIYNEAHIK